jgi:two-component system, cell cycle sensor histidine kinase and response regulator CckA
MRESEPEPASFAPDELTLRKAVEASGEVIFMTDAGGTITYVNPEFVRLYGYRPSEVVGLTTPRILKGGETGVDEYSAFWKQLSRNQVVRSEFANRTKSGELVYVESTANPIFTERGRIGFLAVQRDITARKITEAALQESERRYRALADAAHDSIFIVERDTRITYANRAATERFGVQCEDAIGKRLDQLFPPAEAAVVWDDILTVFTSGMRHSVERMFDTPHGPLWLETWLVPMSSGGSEPDAVMGVARDVTGRKLLERQFLQAQKMEAVGQLAGGIAHDFNNLLTAIIGYSDLLMDRVGHDQALTADVREIKDAGERAGRLTRQLLAFGRKQVLTAQVVDLNDVVKELQKLLRRVIGEDIHLEIATRPDLERVKVDPCQIEQVVVNLAVNARDAMPRGGTIRIATRNVDLDLEFIERHPGASRGKHVALSVQDTGCGMTLEVLAHVFEPFFTTKGPGKRTGLGLATVHGIVTQSGGHIEIDSEPGRGTTVTLYFTSVTETAPPEPPIAAIEPATGTETILLVEDEPSLRHLMQRTLEQAGYSVLNAPTATEAVAMALEPGRRIDLLLSDVVMPDLQGPDVAQRIVRVHPKIRVLYVSGFTSQIALECGTLSRRAVLLPKPFTLQALTAKVRECLDVRF